MKQFPAQLSVEQQAAAAVSALKDFIYTGSQQKKGEFVAAYRDLTRANAPLDAANALAAEFRVRIAGDPQLGPIMEAYRNANGGKFYAPEFIAFMESVRDAALSGNQEKLAMLRDTTFNSQEFVNKVVEPLLKSCAAGASPQKLVPGTGAKEEGLASVPVRVSMVPELEDEDLEKFAKIFKLQFPEGAGREEKARMLAAAMAKEFSVGESHGPDVLRAVADAHMRIKKKEGQAFLDWLAATDARQRETLGWGVQSALASPERMVDKPVLDAFASRQAAKEGAEAVESEKEAEFRKLEGKAAGLNLADLRATFVKTPSPEALEPMRVRLQYCTEAMPRLRDANDSRGKPKEKAVRDADNAKADALEPEARTFSEWLGSLMKEEAAATAEGRLKQAGSKLKLLDSGFAVLHDAYCSTEAKDMGVVTYLRNAYSNNPELYKLYATYVLRLDERSGKLFAGLSADSPTLLEDMAKAIPAMLSRQAVTDGKRRWTESYFPVISPSPDETMRSPGEAAAYTRAANLDPLSASAFYEYTQAAAANGVMSKEEKRLVAMSAAKLYGVEPLLAMKYFKALTNLAELCKDRPGAYLQALMVIGAHIDAETRSVYSPEPSMRAMPLSARTIITRLDDAFSGISAIRPSSLAQFTRYDLLDRNVYIDENPPHLIRQREPPWKQSLISNLEEAGGMLPPYMFPWLTPYVPGNLMTGGMVNNAYPYGGGLVLPQFTFYDVDSRAAAVLAQVRDYLFPSHFALGIGAYLPATTISGLSPNRLLSDIEKAFIRKEAPAYGGKVVGGGFGLGAVAEQPERKWEWGGGGMGSWVTERGGAGFGASATTSGEVFGGAGCVAVPIGKPKLDENGRVAGIKGVNSAVGGYETLEDDTKKALVDAIATCWNPTNPSDLVLTLNMERSKDNKKWMTSRAFYIMKDGRLFELKGGANDFVPMLNYLAGSADRMIPKSFPKLCFGTPTTYAWNVENHVRTGGGVLALDIGKSSLMFHFQSVPFLAAPGEQPPLFLEWGVAGGWTKEGRGKDGTVTRIHEISVPGKMLTLAPVVESKTIATDTVPSITATTQKKYFIQDVSYNLRSVETDKASEFSAGIGLGQAAITATKTQEGVKGPISETTKAYPLGQGGVFYRSQKPQGALGAGLSYEQMQANLDALALTQQSEDMADYVVGLHRIAETMYGSRKMGGSETFMGGLVHVVEQLQKQEGKKTKYDNTLFRFTGFIKGLQNAGRLDVTRVSWVDEMLVDYNALQTNVNALQTNVTQNPQAVEGLLSDFQQRYSQGLRDLFDHYYFGLQLNRTGSVEISLVSREEGGVWAQQEVARAQMRTLFTWDGGFVRGFCMAPAWTGMAPAWTGDSAELSAIAGAGTGFDILNGVWAQRLAFDMGASMGLGEAYNATGRLARDAARPSGGFIQGAAEVYSKVLEDANEYRRLQSAYAAASESLAKGEYSKIPRDIRSDICGRLHGGGIAETVLAKMLKGEEVDLTPDQMAEANLALRRWLDDKRFPISQEFNGRLSTYLGGSAYNLFSGGDIYWDVGAVADYKDRWKAYAIAATRGKKTGVFAGGEVTLTPRLSTGAIVGTTAKDVAGGLSFSLKLGEGVYKLFSYGKSGEIPLYSPPYDTRYAWPARPDVGIGITYTRGTGGVLPFRSSQYPGNPLMR